MLITSLFLQKSKRYTKFVLAGGQKSKVKPHNPCERANPSPARDSGSFSELDSNTVSDWLKMDYSLRTSVLRRKSFIVMFFYFCYKIVISFVGVTLLLYP